MRKRTLKLEKKVRVGGALNFDVLTLRKRRACQREEKKLTLLRQPVNPKQWRQRLAARLTRPRLLLLPRTRLLLPAGIASTTSRRTCLTREQSQISITRAIVARWQHPRNSPHKRQTHSCAASARSILANTNARDAVFLSTFHTPQPSWPCRKRQRSKWE